MQPTAVPELTAARPSRRGRDAQVPGARCSRGRGPGREVSCVQAPLQEICGGNPPGNGGRYRRASPGADASTPPTDDIGNGLPCGLAWQAVWCAPTAACLTSPHIAHKNDVGGCRLSEADFRGCRFLSVTGVGLGVLHLAMGARRGGQESWQPPRDNAPSRKLVVDSAARLATGCLAVSATGGAGGDADGVLASHNPAGRKRLSGTLF